jgi:hypothetical protein
MRGLKKYVQGNRKTMIDDCGSVSWLVDGAWHHGNGRSDFVKSDPGDAGGVEGWASSDSWAEGLNIRSAS